MAEKVEILRIEVDQETTLKKLTELEKTLARLKNEQIQYQKELKKSNGTNTDAAKSLVKVNNEIKKNTQSQRELTKTVLAESNSLNGLKAKVASMIVQRNKMDLSTRQGVKQFNALNREILTYTNRIKQAEARGGTFSRNVGNYPKLFGAALLQLAGLTGGIYAFVNVLKNGFGIIKNFDEVQSSLASILGKTRKEIISLTDDAIKYGKSTIFTASQVSSLQVELAKLGFTLLEIRNATPGILRFATATGADLASSAQIAGAALRSFDLSATETNRVVSVLSVATTKSALTWQDYETVISTVFPVARAFNFSLEETVALEGKLKDAGFDASKSSTALRNIILNLADSNGALAKRLGGAVNSFDEFIPALIKLRREGIDLNETLELTDKRSVAAFNQFLRSAESAKILADSLIDVNDQLNAMVETKLDTIAGDTTKMTSAWEGFILSLDKGQGILSVTIRSLLQYSTAILATASDDTLNFWQKLGTMLNPFALAAQAAANATGNLIDEFEQGQKQISIEEKITEALWGNTEGLVYEYEKLIMLYGELSEKGQYYRAVIDGINKALREQADEAARARKEGRKRITEEIDSVKLQNNAIFDQNKARFQADVDFQKRRLNLVNNLKNRTVEVNKNIADDNEKTNARILEVEEYKNEAIYAGTESLLGSISSLFGQGTAEYKILASAEALISAYAAINKTLADPKLTFPANVIASIAIGAAALANVAKINEVQFAEGGIIGDRGVHLKPDARGDNRLIIASDSETILNSKQQARIGAENLKRAGVPGYADGGYIGSQAGQGVIREVENNSQITKTFKNLPPIILDYSEFTRFQNRIRIKERVKAT